MSDWLKRAELLRDAEVQGGFASQCSGIPKLPSGAENVCGFDLINLVATSPTELDGIVSKFLLALICRDSAETCNRYGR